MIVTNRPLRIWGFVVTLVAFSLFVGAGTALAEDQDDAPEIDREIHVEMHNFHFEPHDFHVRPGETVKFIVNNPSTAFHTFTLYRDRRDRSEALVNEGVSPKSTTTIIVTMPEEEITLYLVCLPHEAGLEMIGSVNVTLEDPEDED